MKKICITKDIFTSSWFKWNGVLCQDLKEDNLDLETFWLSM